MPARTATITAAIAMRPPILTPDAESERANVNPTHFGGDVRGDVALAVMFYGGIAGGVLLVAAGVWVAVR